jgi:hypothetical protein
VTTADLTIVDSGRVTDGLIAALKAFTPLATLGVLVGDGDTPAEAVTARYVSVRQLPDNATPTGGWAQELAVRRMKWALICTGENRAQSDWIATQVMALLYERAQGGGTFTYAITVDGHAVIHRELVSDLGLVPSGRLMGRQLHIGLLVHRTS